MDKQKLISLDTAARYMGVLNTAVRAWAHHGQLESWKQIDGSSLTSQGACDVFREKFEGAMALERKRYVRAVAHFAQGRLDL